MVNEYIMGQKVVVTEKIAFDADRAAMILFGQVTYAYSDGSVDIVGEYPMEANVYIDKNQWTIEQLAQPEPEFLTIVRVGDKFYWRMSEDDGSEWVSGEGNLRMWSQIVVYAADHAHEIIMVVDGGTL